MDNSLAVSAGVASVDPPRTFIAATALHHNLTVVTRNVTDFASLGVRVFDPWSG